MNPIQNRPLPEDNKPHNKEKTPNPAHEKISQTARKQMKSHEAEDIQKKHVKLKRQNSSHSLGRGAPPEDEKKALQQKSGHMWESIKRVPSKYGDGYIYTFRLKKEFDPLHSESLFNAHDKLEELFPAVEPANQSLQYLFENLNAAGNFQAAQVSKLGYKVIYTQEEFHLELPDLNALLAGWETVRATHNKELQPLDIIESSGITDDLTFTEEFLAHDCLLSSGEEFVHDHCFHVMPYIFAVLYHEDDFDKEKAKLALDVAKIYQKIMVVKNALGEGKLQLPDATRDSLMNNIKMIETALGANVDTLTTYNPDTVPENIEDNLLLLPTSTLNWFSFFEKKFDSFSASELSSIWSQVKEMYEVIHENRK